jgi:hypothetical protein
MTCIVSLVDGDTVYMGGDSAAVEDGHYLTRTRNPKVFINGAYLIGYTSSFRMGQLLEFADLPQPEGLDLYRFMATAFVERVRP